MKQKLLVAALALMLVLCTVLGVTLAWLTVETNPIKNTFVYGNINITLTETTPVVDGEGVGTIKFLPGQEVAKDPVVTVTGGSEKCWLFVKVDKGAALDGNVGYAINTSAVTAVPGHADWYYVEVDASAEDQLFYLLTDIEPSFDVDGEGYDDAHGTVKGLDKTKAEIDALQGADLSITFTAFAIQYDAAADVEAAWGFANGLLES